MQRGSVIKAALWRKPKKESQRKTTHDIRGMTPSQETDIVTPKNMKILNEAQLEDSPRALKKKNVKVIRRGNRQTMIDSSVEGFDINIDVAEPDQNKDNASKEKARNLFFLKFDKDMNRVGVSKQFDWRKNEQIVPYHLMKNAVHDVDREKASSVEANFVLARGKKRKSAFFTYRQKPVKEIAPSMRELEILGQRPKASRKVSIDEASLYHQTELRVTPTASEYQKLHKNNVVQSRKATITYEPKMYDAEPQQGIPRNLEAEELQKLIKFNIKPQLEANLLEKVVKRTLSPDRMINEEDRISETSELSEENIIKKHESTQKLIRRVKREIGSMEVKAWRYQSRQSEEVGSLASFERLMEKEQAKFSFISKQSKYENLKKRGKLVENRLNIIRNEDPEREQRMARFLPDINSSRKYASVTSKASLQRVPKKRPHQLNSTIQSPIVLLDESSGSRHSFASPAMQSQTSLQTFRRLNKDESQLLSLALNRSEDSLTPHLQQNPEVSLRQQFDQELKQEFKKERKQDKKVVTVMEKSLKKQGELARDILLMVDIKPLKKMRKKYGNNISKDLLRKLGTSSSFSSDTSDHQQQQTQESPSSLEKSPSFKQSNLSVVEVEDKLQKIEEEQHEQIQQKLKKFSKNFQKKLKVWHDEEIRVIDYTRQKFDYILNRPAPKRASQL